ncbi:MULTISPECIES: S1C family serine protease [Bacillus]|uniref:Serine protease n=1 Tax=Bacillus pumilus (strain SAFR-032) TaxID=315750 RepID=A8FH89_BACP2|nr:trypsin-like peptidase domain-containing protein [Bacillus pumilus]ABV63606.1 serine protease [Bacillus pumilus SAFR-032]MBC3641612.1 trypsin-like peptidase domain-containing protein [Bacillus pumilus]MBC3646282.1 trypsin-like peptidase domain-containing protein [Bacillus pumilus]MBC3650288.1 trypsin-like peptidase domain-containing protein [Bacillus pumilus]MBC3652026.1 trypsin-like peptidase domain-containing protein [Bacillus pumilus]
MDFRREDEEKKLNQQEDVHQENEKQIDEPEKEKELVFQPHENEASATQESVTNHSPQMGDDRASKKEKKRKAAWLSPILGGIIGGGLVLGITPLLPQSQDTAANNQTQTASSEPATSENFSTKQITNATNVSDMVEDLEPTIVGVSNYQTTQNSFGLSGDSTEAEAGTGSGVIFKKDGKKAYIITNNHVVEGANKLKVTLYDGKTKDAKLVGSDVMTDLAVVEINADGIDKVASFGDSSKLRAGDKVIAIGNPLGAQFSGTVTEGIISGLDRTVEANTSSGTVEMNVLQTDAAINPGNSGGPLINTDGQVIGINSLKISESGVESLGFAIPSNDVKPIVDELLKNGKVERPYLGVQMIDLEQVPETYQENTLGLFDKQIGKGIYVKDVSKGSPAQKAGLKSGDVIIKFKGKNVANSSQLKEILYKETKVGDKTTMTVIREGKNKNLDITLGQSETE